MAKFRRPIRRTVVSVLALVLVPYAFSRIASSWRRVTVHAQPSLDSSTAIAPSLRVACYNIAHGRGQSQSNWTGESRQTRKKRLDEIAELIKSVDADIVVLNEVDFDSSWSHSVNQAAYLAEAAGYPYRAEQRNLDFRVLFWTWRFGNAVLSRVPIHEAKTVDFPSYSMIETVLAGKKRGLNCSVEFDGARVSIAAVHLSHRSEAIRAKCTELMTASILVGDFNSTPKGFPGTVTDNDEGNAIDRLDATSRFQRRPLNPPHKDTEMTYHSAAPQSIIDWVLVSTDWHIADYQAVPSLLSDHRMVVAELIPVVTDMPSDQRPDLEQEHLDSRMKP